MRSRRYPPPEGRRPGIYRGYEGDGFGRRNGSRREYGHDYGPGFRPGIRQSYRRDFRAGNGPIRPGFYDRDFRSFREGSADGMTPGGPFRNEWDPFSPWSEPRGYARVYDGGRQPGRRRPSRTALENIRRNPVRSGLIGLAVAGTAAPIAINRHQQALRTNPDHESMMARGLGIGDPTERGVVEAWQEMEGAAADAAEERERAIEESVARYANYGLTRELAAAIYDAADEHAIDPEVAYGLVRAESSFKNTSTSPVGAVGLTQLMPRTAEWLEPGITKSELRDPDTNLRIGFGYLRSLIDKYSGDTRLALLAYNRGPGTVDRELRNGRDPDNGYADFVFGREDHGHRLFTSR